MMYLKTILASLLATSVVSAAIGPAPPPGYGYGGPDHTSRPSKTTLSTVASPTPSLTCALKYCEIICIQVFPQSCYCENAAKKACFDNCGGPVPSYQVISMTLLVLRHMLTVVSSPVPR